MTTPPANRQPFVVGPQPPTVQPPPLPDVPVTFHAWSQFAGMLVNAATCTVVLVKLLGAGLDWAWSLVGWSVVLASFVGVLFFGLPLLLAFRHYEQRVALMRDQRDLHYDASRAVIDAFARYHAPRAERAPADHIDAVPVRHWTDAARSQATRVVDAFRVAAEPEQEPADERPVASERKEPDTQRLDGPRVYTAAMQKMYELRSRGIKPTFEVCKGLGMSRADWQAALAEFERLEYAARRGKGKPADWI